MNDFDLLVNYIHNNLEGEELRKLEFRLKNETGLQKELELLQETRKQLLKTEKERVFSILRKINAQKKKKKRIIKQIYIYSAIAASITVLVYFSFNLNNNKEPITQNNSTDTIIIETETTGKDSILSGQKSEKDKLFITNTNNKEKIKDSVINPAKENILTNNQTNKEDEIKDSIPVNNNDKTIKILADTHNSEIELQNKDSNIKYDSDASLKATPTGAENPASKSKIKQYFVFTVVSDDNELGFAPQISDSTKITVIFYNTEAKKYKLFKDTLFFSGKYKLNVNFYKEQDKDFVIMQYGNKAYKLKESNSFKNLE